MQFGVLFEKAMTNLLNMEAQIMVSLTQNQIHKTIAKNGLCKAHDKI